MLENTKVISPDFEDQFMNIVYPDRKSFNQTLKEAADDSFNFIVVVTAALNLVNVSRLKTQLDECVRVLKNGGVLFVQGRPEYLPELGVHLDRYLNFKYWIAIESQLQQKERGLPSVHAAEASVARRRVAAALADLRKVLQRAGIHVEMGSS